MNSLPGHHFSLQTKAGRPAQRPTGQAASCPSLGSGLPQTALPPIGIPGDFVAGREMPRARCHQGLGVQGWPAIGPALQPLLTPPTPVSCLVTWLPDPYCHSVPSSVLWFTPHTPRSTLLSRSCLLLNPTTSRSSVVFPSSRKPTLSCSALPASLSSEQGGSAHVSG